MRLGQAVMTGGAADELINDSEMLRDSPPPTVPLCVNLC